MEEERRTGKVKEKVIEILERVLGDHIQFSKEIISANELHGEVSPNQPDPNFISFAGMFRELDALRTSEQIAEPVRRVAEKVYQKSHLLDREEYFDRRRVH